MPSSKTPVVDVDFQAESDRRRTEALDDVTLVYVMLGLHGEMEGAPDWGRTPRARTLARIAFTEIAARWIPPDVFGDAFRQLTANDEAIEDV